MPRATTGPTAEDVTLLRDVALTRRNLPTSASVRVSVGSVAPAMSANAPSLASACCHCHAMGAEESAGCVPPQSLATYAEAESVCPSFAVPVTLAPSSVARPSATLPVELSLQSSPRVPSARVKEILHARYASASASVTT